MQAQPREESALGAARARFLGSIPRRVTDLRTALALAVATPDSEPVRNELRRRMHALFASAQVFRMDELVSVIQDGVYRLDTVRDAKTELSQDDLDALTAIVRKLPGLAGVPAGDAPTTDEGPARVPAKGFSVAVGGRVGSGSFTTAIRSRESASPTAVDSVLSVLVVDDVDWQERIRELLPAERFEVLCASDVESALRLARSSGPDLVLGDQALLFDPNTDFIGRLRSDPLTDFVPVIALHSAAATMDAAHARREGADETLAKPLDSETLVRTIGRATGLLREGAGTPSAVGEVTAEELADRLTAELHRGLVETLDSGREVRVSLGEGADVLAAVWGAVGRVRAHLNQRSGGRISFRDTRARGGPGLLALVEAEAAAEGAASDVSLKDRRIVVVDDDPAVVWFFAGLLREEEADVIECTSGADALTAIRARRPDVVISDILMPGVDGFSLCRQLHRDPELADVPVILLSWKEDYLQRMRELRAGASGYLRKEAGSAQILSRIRDVLRPRARLESQLRTGGEVRGRVDGLGMTTLLRTAASLRDNARVTVRDTAHLFEIDLRGGNIADLTRTATDGAFARGPSLVPHLLGIGSARFTVASADTPVRLTFTTHLEETLAEGLRHLRALLQSVSGTGLSQAAHVLFAEDVLGAVLATSPAHVTRIVENVRERGPRMLLITGEVDPNALETTLLDLARRGAIASVRDLDGIDRVSMALASTTDADPIFGPGARESQPPLALGRVGGAPLEDLDQPFDGRTAPQAGVPSSVPPPVPPLPVPPPAPSATAAALSAPPQPLSEPPGVIRPSAETAAAVQAPEPTPTMKAAAKTQLGLGPIPAPAVRSAPPPPPPPRPVPAPRPAAAQTSTPAKVSPAAAPRASVDRGLGSWWLLIAGALALLVWVALRVLVPATPAPAADTRPAAPPPAPVEPAPVAPAPAVDMAFGVDEVAAPEASTPTTPSPSPSAIPAVQLGPSDPVELSFGRVIAGIGDADRPRVRANQGVLVIEAPAGAIVWRVKAGGRTLGTTPLRAVMAEGRYDLIFEAAGNTPRFRAVSVRSGQTRIIPAP